MTNVSPVLGSQTDSSHSPYRRKIDPDSYFGPKPEGIPASRKAWFRTVLWTNPTPKPLPRTGPPNLNVVSDIRPRQLSAKEEGTLIELAQAGDARAARELVLAHSLFIRGKAGKKWSKLNRTTGQAPPRRDRAVEHDDLVASGLLALAQAIGNYEPSKKNKLNAFARKGINGAIADTVRDWGNAPGLSGMDSRIQRFIRSHPYWPADWIRMKFPNFSLERIEWEQSIARPV